MNENKKGPNKESFEINAKKMQIDAKKKPHLGCFISQIRLKDLKNSDIIA